jgi:hypothetical protein
VSTTGLWIVDCGLWTGDEIEPAGTAGLWGVCSGQFTGEAFTCWWTPIPHYGESYYEASVYSAHSRLPLQGQLDADVVAEGITGKTGFSMDVQGGAVTLAGPQRGVT